MLTTPAIAAEGELLDPGLSDRCRHGAVRHDFAAGRCYAAGYVSGESQRAESKLEHHLE